MNKLFVAVLVLVVVLGGYAAYQAGQNSVLKAGATLSPDRSLGNRELYNSLQTLFQDVTNVRKPLSGLLSYSSSTYTIPTVVSGMATTTVSSSTPGASGLAGAVLGDFVQVSVSTTTIQGFSAYGRVTSNDTLLLTFQAASSSAWTGGSVGLDVRVLPKATYAAPATLLTSTSTTPGQ